MLIKLITILSIYLSASAYILELEVEGRKKQCVSEIFSKDQPIAFRGKVLSSEIPNFSIYLTIETLAHKLLTHTKLDSTTKTSVLTFNNPEDQQLNLCVDNFEGFDISIEINIRFGVNLGDVEITPTKNVMLY